MSSSDIYEPRYYFLSAAGEKFQDLYALLKAVVNGSECRRRNFEDLLLLLRLLLRDLSAAGKTFSWFICSVKGNC